MTAAKPIRLMLAGNNAIVLACLEQLFALEESFAVIARCGKGEDALDTLRALRPDILLLDLPPAAVDGVNLLREIKKIALPTRAVLLAGTLTESDQAEAVRLGVRGIVPKEVSPALLAQCIRRVHAGGVWLQGASASSPAKRGQTGSEDIGGALTPREREVVRLISGGLDNRQIAKRLRLSEATVKTHLHQIYQKLSLRDRLQLSLYGREKGLT
jgi:two-component system nitrate/nitrite response regulator NarL